jgi:tetratricopeptide (TPR) repeat protein
MGDRNIKVELKKKQYLQSKHPDIDKSSNNIGSIYDSKGDYDQALDYFTKLLEIKKKAYHLLIQ